MQIKLRQAIVGFVTMAFMGIGMAQAAAETYWVDQKNPAAADNNPGSADKPFKTVSAAITKIRPGDTVTVRAGIYREMIRIKQSGTAENRITIQAAPNETVVISGADIVAGWQKFDDEKKRPIWRKTGWSSWQAYGANTPDSANSRKQGPQLIVNNRLYRHVAHLDEMVPGSFCYDAKDGGTIYMWMIPPQGNQSAVVDPAAQWWDNPVDLTSDDPNRQQVEASTRPGNILVDNQSYITIRGFIVRYNSAHAQLPGIMINEERNKNFNSRHNVVEDCIVEYCHGAGLKASGDNITVRGCYVRFNGGIGGGGHLINSLWEKCVFEGNNTTGHSHGWEAGGVKFYRCDNLTVRDSMFINNDGPGLWFDRDNTGNILERNYCSFNSGSGIMMEVSPDFDSKAPDARAQISDWNLDRLGVSKDHPVAPNIVRNNICVGNRWDGIQGSGILLQLASNTIVVNNTIYGNDMYGIFVRYHPYYNSGHRCVDNVIENNLIVNNGGSQISVTPDPVDNPGYVVRNVSDYNLFWSALSWDNRRTLGTAMKWDEVNFSRWGKTQDNFTYSVEEWFKIRGFDEHSIQWDPRMLSPQSMDFGLRSDSPAIGAGKPTEYVTDDYLGRKRPAGRAPSIGALEYFPGIPQRPHRPMTGGAGALVDSVDASQQ